jgi:hypothetical protein
MFFGSPGTGGYLGNNKTKKQDKNLEENNIPFFFLINSAVFI